MEQGRRTGRRNKTQKLKKKKQAKEKASKQLRQHKLEGPSGEPRRGFAKYRGGAGSEGPAWAGDGQEEQQGRAGQGSPSVVSAHSQLDSKRDGAIPAGMARERRPDPVLCPWNAWPEQVHAQQAASGQKAALREAMGRGGEWEGAELGKVGSTSRLSLRENNLYTQLGFTHGPARHILL